MDVWTNIDKTLKQYGFNIKIMQKRIIVWIFQRDLEPVVSFVPQQQQRIYNMYLFRNTNLYIHTLNHTIILYGF